MYMYMYRLLSTHHLFFFIHPFIHSSIYPFIHLFIHLSIYPSIHPSIHSYIYPFIHPIIHLSTCIYHSQLRHAYTEDIVRDIMTSANTQVEMEAEFKQLKEDRDILRSIFPTGNSKVHVCFCLSVCLSVCLSK